MRSSILKKFTYWFCKHWRTMFTNEANFFPSIMVGDVCGGKKIYIKTVSPRNVVGCVMRHNWLGWGLLWLFYRIVRRELTGFHYRDEINKAYVTVMLVLWTRTWCLWTETPFRAGLVLSMITLSAKTIRCMDWPSPHVNLTTVCMIQTPKSYMCSASSTTYAGWPRKRTHSRLGKNLSFCNQKTDSQFHLYVYDCFSTLEVARRLFLLNFACDLNICRKNE